MAVASAKKASTSTVLIQKDSSFSGMNVLNLSLACISFPESCRGYFDNFAQFDNYILYREFTDCYTLPYSLVAYTARRRENHSRHCALEKRMD